MSGTETWDVRRDTRVVLVMSKTDQTSYNGS